MKAAPPSPGKQVRSRNDGQIGFIVEWTDPRTGKPGLGVRLDRKQENIVRPYHEGMWEVVVRPPLTPLQVARVAYQADCALRSARGEYSVKDWRDLKEDARISFVEGLPPGADEERKAVWAGVKEAVGG